MTDERRQRPPTSRTRPIRNWSTLFPSGRPPVETNGADGAGPRADGTVVGKSVELGYRIIDEYIRQGEQVARRVGDRSYDAAGMTRDAQDMATRMTGYAAQMTTLWMDAMQGMAGGAFPGAPTGWWSPPTPEAARGPLPRTAPTTEAARGVARIRVVVEARGPVEVALDVRPGHAADRLTVYALRGQTPGSPRLADVTIEPPHDDQPFTLRIRVPADHPPGRYTGTITDDDTAEAVGTVELSIIPAA